MFLRHEIKKTSMFVTTRPNTSVCCLVMFNSPNLYNYPEAKWHLDERQWTRGDVSFITGFTSHGIKAHNKTDAAHN